LTLGLTFVEINVLSIMDSYDVGVGRVTDIGTSILIVFHTEVVDSGSGCLYFSYDLDLLIEL